MIALLVVLAGGVGACLRYAAVLAAGSRPLRATWVVNLIGSFALGLLAAQLGDRGSLLVVGTGLLGGFTTFSTAAVDSVHITRERSTVVGAAHAIGMLVVCVTAALLGALIGR
ncbi:CrcB family protein [Aeromicrobium phragmitis]|uniref:Fluoride-specific ion channel FluC n=1 Tax=Aeromicrobium phragmitis TaxID=2478914 RepID=A0A3L8PI79_9ACTN|nr:CrcB family protein [Aeromicrobium phragmitis]RLV54800.1 CrcB family protein [Aeromicrobium phragmitis]